MLQQAFQGKPLQLYVPEGRNISIPSEQSLSSVTTKLIVNMATIYGPHQLLYLIPFSPGQPSLKTGSDVLRSDNNSTLDQASINDTHLSGIQTPTGALPAGSSTYRLTLNQYHPGPITYYKALYINTSGSAATIGIMLMLRLMGAKR